MSFVIHTSNNIYDEYEKKYILCIFMYCTYKYYLLVNNNLIIKNTPVLILIKRNINYLILFHVHLGVRKERKKERRKDGEWERWKHYTGISNEDDFNCGSLLELIFNTYNNVLYGYMDNRIKKLFFSNSLQHYCN